MDTKRNLSNYNVEELYIILYNYKLFFRRYIIYAENNIGKDNDSSDNKCYLKEII